MKVMRVIWITLVAIWQLITFLLATLASKTLQNSLIISLISNTPFLLGISAKSQQMELSVFGVSMERLGMLNWLKLVPLSIRIGVSGLNFSLTLHVLVRMCKTSQ